MLEALQTARHCQQLVRDNAHKVRAFGDKREKGVGKIRHHIRQHDQKMRALDACGGVIAMHLIGKYEKRISR